MSASSRTRRRLVAASLTTVVIGGLAVGYSRLGPADDVETVAPAVTVETATVTVGNLELGDRLDGTLDRTSSLTVVHRIDGVTPTATSATASSSSSAAAPAATQTFAGVCDAAPTDTSVPAPSTTTAPPTTAADTTTTVADTTTTVAATTTTTVAVTPSTTVVETTTTVCTTDTTAATTGGQGAPTGGAAPGGAGATGAAAGTSATSAAGSTTATTEMVTSVSVAGATIAPGDVLYSVEGQPVLAMIGTVPAWRTLSTDSDDGIDVLQLEYSLTALGYDADGALTIDSTFDSDTQAAVEAWQEGLGVETSGEVALGRIVFLPATTTVSSVSAQVGDDLTDGDAVLSLAGGQQQVTVSVPAEDRAVVGVGLAVEVGGVAGVVSRLRSASGSTDVDVQAVISLDSALEAQDGAAVTVSFTVTDAEGVFLVPAEALVSRLDGTYAVRAVTTEGLRGDWMTVQPHGVSNGDVAVTGDGIAEGLLVEIPAT